MDDHESAIAALEAALARFLKAYDDWRAGDLDDQARSQALDHARAALEEARRHLARVERSRRPPLAD